MLRFTSAKPVTDASCRLGVDLSRIVASVTGKYDCSWLSEHARRGIARGTADVRCRRPRSGPTIAPTWLVRLRLVTCQSRVSGALVISAYRAWPARIAALGIVATGHIDSCTVQRHLGAGSYDRGHSRSSMKSVSRIIELFRQPLGYTRRVHPRCGGPACIQTAVTWAIHVTIVWLGG